MKILILAFLCASGFCAVGASLPKFMDAAAVKPTEPTEVNRDWAVLAFQKVPTNAAVIFNGVDESKMLTPILVQLSDVIREWDLVMASKVQTNAVAWFYFRTRPATNVESSMLQAIRTKTLVRVMEGTNVMAEGSAQGFARRSSPEGGNLSGLMLRFDSLDDAEAAVAKIRYSADVQWRHMMNSLEGEMRRRADNRKNWLL